MNTESQTDQLKQRIAEYLSRKGPPPIGPLHLLHDCLKHIEELEHETCEEALQPAQKEALQPKAQ